MATSNLFAIGDLCLDILQEASGQAKLGEEHKLEDLEFSIGGNAANFAVVAAQLGLKPFLITSTGKDFATPFLKTQLRKSKVKSILIQSSKPNAFSSIAINRRGERAIQSIKNCLNDITTKQIERLLLPKLKPNDIVFFGGFYHLKNLRPGFQSLLKKIKSKHAVICFDTCYDTSNKWNVNNYLKFIDYLFVNDIEIKHIAKGKTTQDRINHLQRKGATTIIYKVGPKGSMVFTKNSPPAKLKAIRTRAEDTTGAGDAFNAGFVLGLTRGWSSQNCARAGNFVASHKIRQHGPAAPPVKSVERYVSKNNEPTIIITKDYSEMSKAAASVVIDLLKRKPDASIVLPAGRTPKLLYKMLSQAHKRGKADFSKSRLFQLDEYVGLPRKDKRSFARFLDEHLLGKIDAKSKNVHFLNGAAKDMKKECASMEAVISKHGIDLCVLGIGPNGHVGVNEPGSAISSRTRIIRLRPETIKKEADIFRGVEAPTRGLTLGLATITDNSRHILLLASGGKKRQAIRQTLTPKPTAEKIKKCPAVALRRHRNLTVIVDRKASA